LYYPHQSPTSPNHQLPLLHLNHSHHLVSDGSVTRHLWNTGSNGRISSSTGNVLSAEVREERSSAGAESARASEAVDLADASEVFAASSVGGGGWCGEEFAAHGSVEDGWNVLENVTFSKDVSTLTDLESVSAVVVPVVVDGVEESVSLDLGGSSAGVVDVVALHGDEIVGSVEVDTPVVVSVASSRVVGNTVDVVV
jgi:hypothetical protein